MVVSLNKIISRLLADLRCQKLLAEDGITTSNLSIKGMQGIIEPLSIDARAARKNVPAIGEAASIAKNLDEYQYIICSLIPSLPDSNPSKLALQKYRVATVAAFAMLSTLLRDHQDELVNWNRHARALLEETSEAYVKAKSNAKLQVASHNEAFEFFGVPEDRIGESLRTFYGQ